MDHCRPLASAPLPLQSAMEEIGRVWATDTQKHSEIVKRAYAPLLIAAPKKLAYRISVAQRKAPRHLRLARHNHMSIVAHFNTDEEILGREIVDFFETLR